MLSPVLRVRQRGPGHDGSGCQGPDCDVAWLL